MHRENRIEYIDLLRIIACFLVIVNHTNSAIFLNSTPHNSLWWYSVGIFFLSRIAVPIFIMITGATILSREENYKKTLKRVVRAIVVLILFSLIYYCRKALKSDSFSLQNFLAQIYNKPITNAYWYMYLYIALLLMIPFVQKMVKNMKKIDLLIYFFVSLLVNGVWPILLHYQPAFAFNTNFYMPLFESYICYLMLGYYFTNYNNKDKRRFLIALFGFGTSIIISMILTYFEYMKNAESYTFFSNRTLITVAFPSGCFFYLCSFINGGAFSKSY